MLKINAISKGDFVPPYTVLLLSLIFRHGFHFSTNLYRNQNVQRYLYSFKNEDDLKSDCSILR